MSKLVGALVAGAAAVVLVVVAVIALNHSTGRPPGYPNEANTQPTAAGPPSAQTVASSVVGSKVSGGGDLNGETIHSDFPTGIVHTDAAGDATVQVEMDMYAPGEYTTGALAGPINEGDYAGTVTLYADGASSFTVNG
jgi:hypothetical protein